MQNSELFRRGVVLPLNEQAECMLKNNTADESTTVRYLEIQGQQEFEAIWKSGLFEEINNLISTMIDDYEEEFIDIRNLPLVIEAIEVTRKKKPKISSQVNNFLTALVSIVSEAMSIKRPLLVIL